MEQNKNNESEKSVRIMSNKEFIIRFILFAIFACVLPFAFIVYRYGLFRDTTSKLTGFGIIAILIVVIFTIYVLNMLKKAYPYSMGSQCINGFLKVEMPLILLFYWISSIEGNIELFKQAMICVIICEAIAIPINPLPIWAHQKNIELTGLSIKEIFSNFKGGFKK